MAPSWSATRGPWARGLVSNFPLVRHTETYARAIGAEDTTMSSVTRFLASGICSLLLIGCGGSGGDNGNTIVTVPLADITSANAPGIAGAVMKTALEGGGLGVFAGPGGGAVLSNPNSQLFATLGTIQKSQTDSLTQKVRSGVLQATIPPTDEPCAISGTVTVSGQVDNSMTLSPTDVFTLVFSDCDDGAGIVNGTYSMQVNNFGGDLLSGSFTIGVTVSLTAFRIDDGQELVTANGSVAMTIDYTAAPTLTISMTTTSLTVADGTSSQTLSSFSLTQTINELDSSFSMSVSGALTSSEFTGRVTFSTAADLLNDGTGFAYTGEVTISGAGGASISVIVLDNMLVSLEVDVDGDGGLEAVIPTSWDELI